MVTRVLVEPPEVMNPKREVFCSKLSPTRRTPREIERKLQAYPTQVIEKVDSGLRGIVSLLEDLSAIEQVSCEGEHPTPIETGQRAGAP